MQKTLLTSLLLAVQFIYAATPESSNSNIVITTTTSAPNITDPATLLPAQGKVVVLKPKKAKKYKSSKSPNVGIRSMHFDYSYNGDLAGAVKNLQGYDYSLSIEPPMGRKQDVAVSLDLTDATLDQVLKTLNGQADGFATVQYNPNNNSIKVIYSSKIRDIGYDAMMESKRWRDGHKPKPIITPDGVLEYPFGLYQPVIPCKIGMICDIRLGAGEVLMDWAISDRGNWQMYSKSKSDGGDSAQPALAFSGSGANLIPHILIKPTTAATTTNLVVLTNKRTYDMLLKATDSDYVLAAGFYFPNMLMQGIEDEKQQLRDQRQDGGSNLEESNNAYNIDMGKLNTDNYVVSGDDVSWKPTAIFDDGVHVWIKFNNTNQIAPALLEVNNDDDTLPYALLRYYPQPGNLYMVNKMFDKAVLVMGINDQAKKVFITRKKAEVSFFHKIFG